MLSHRVHCRVCWRTGNNLNGRREDPSEAFPWDHEFNVLRGDRFLPFWNLILRTAPGFWYIWRVGNLVSVLLRIVVGPLLWKIRMSVMKCTCSTCVRKR